MANRIEEVKARALEAGKLLGAKEERERIINEAENPCIHWSPMKPKRKCDDCWQALKGGE